jgi:hypothetical protein
VRSRLFLIACGALLCVAATEVAYRVARAGICVGRDGGALFAAQPDYGWTHLANASVWIYGCDGRDYEFQNQLRTNSNGLRDREISYDKPADSVRVLLLGDTITEAVQVPLEQTFAKLTEAKLRETFEYIDVINAGCASYGTDNELLFFRAEGRRYNADLVLLVLSTRNDAIDVSEALNSRSAMSALFPAKQYFTLDADGDLLREDAAKMLEEPPEPAATTKLWSAVSSNLFLVRTLGRALHSDDEPAMPARESAPVVTWQAIYKTPMADEVVRGWLLVERLIEALDRDVQASGAQLLVAIMPGREEVESALSPPREAGSAAAPANWDIGQGNRMARSILDRLDIQYIDLSPLLRRHADASKSTGFYKVDVHLAPDGHRVVASELANWLAPMLTTLRNENRAH